jgi:hypothetical protein
VWYTILGVLAETTGSQAIIPNLLQPLQYTPTKTVLPHYEANLSALLCLMVTVRETGRIARWRGQIIDILCRLWLQLEDLEGLSESGEYNTHVIACGLLIYQRARGYDKIDKRVSSRDILRVG